MLSRRHFLAGAAGAAITGSAWSRLALAAPSAQHQRFVLIILRGGMDGLAAVAPYGDRNYESARRGLAIDRADGLRDLDGFFALHPSLEHLHTLYKAGDMAPVHAVATPYRKRSHFDAQNVLELASESPHASRQGWLNRAVALMDKQSPGTQREAAIAIGQSVPLALRGPESVGSWAPAMLPDPDVDIMARISDLYAEDDYLGPKLQAALEADMMAGTANAQSAKRGRRGKGNSLEPLVDAAGKFLSHESGPRVAVLEMNGWDTHANQGKQQGNLARHLGNLDQGMERLHKALGPAWDNTVVLVVTEFGRTVAMNGTRGTDHGTASVAFFVGGAVDGARVGGDWPGLARSRLHQDRDLRPVTDMRSLYKTVLVEHLGLDAREVDATVFAGAPPSTMSSRLLRG